MAVPLLITNKKREIKVGKLIYPKEMELNESLSITENVRFKRSIDCAKSYNHLHLVLQCSGNSTIYHLDNRTHNEFINSGNCVALFSCDTTSSYQRPSLNNYTQQGHNQLSFLALTQTAFGFNQRILCKKIALVPPLLRIYEQLTCTPEKHPVEIKMIFCLYRTVCLFIFEP